MTARAHLTAIAAIIVAMLVFVPSVALGETAAGNDEVTGATQIQAPGYLNHATHGATPSSADPAGCWDFSAVTLWYQVVAPTAGTIRLSGFFGDHTRAVGIETFTGSPGSLQAAGCDFNNGFDEISMVTMDVQADQTLYVMMAIPDWYPIDEEFGGWVRFRAVYLRPDPHITSFTIDRKGSVTKSGIATVRGTITCRLSGTAIVQMTLTQSFARSTATATKVGEFPCTPSITHWSMSATSSTALRFGAGKAAASGTASTYGDLAWSTMSATRIVTLHSTK